LAIPQAREPEQQPERYTAMADDQRGFAGMDPEKQREIASKGGQAAHQKGTAHEFTPEEARAAGRKGGEAVSRDREHMSQIGRKGGEASHGGGRRATRGEHAPERTAVSRSRPEDTAGGELGSGCETSRSYR